MSECPDFAESLTAGYVKCGITKPDNGLLLAVSGGVDSMALLHGTMQLWPEETDRIVVAHVNHQLRGFASQTDAKFVEEAAIALGLRFVLLTCDVPAECEASGGSIEEVARRSRYQLLQNTALENKLCYVACAHHMDDQAETVLHNILRGTGLRGVRGMQRCRLMTDGVQLVRPMLDMRQSDLVDYLADSGLSHRDDPSNQQPEFTRNRIRHQLLPLLKNEVNAAVDRNLVSLAAQAEQTVEVLDALAERILSEVILEQQPDTCRLDRVKLATWPCEVIRHVLSVLWIQQQWPRQKMTFRHYHHLARAVEIGFDHGEDLPGSVRCQLSANILRLNKVKRGLPTEAPSTR